MYIKYERREVATKGVEGKWRDDREDGRTMKGWIISRASISFENAKNKKSCFLFFM